MSKSSLVRFDHNRYSVAVKATRRTAQLRVYADRIVVWCDSEIGGEHARRFGRGQTAYDPWHCLPVLARKPGALRNGDPFRNWDLPPALAQIRRRLAGHDDGDRQFVDILTAVAEVGLDAVETACAEALSARLFGRDRGFVHQVPRARVGDKTPSVTSSCWRSPESLASSRARETWRDLVLLTILRQSEHGWRRYDANASARRRYGAPGV